MNLFNIYYYLSEHCDAPQPWGVYFQDSASPQMEALVELHDNIMFYLVIILFGVAWIMVSIIRNYIFTRSPISNKYLNHGTLIELIWTITPALILILIAFPSFKLLYLMDEVTDPSLTLFVEGHQWYWSYQYPDFTNDDDEELEFDSYLIPESDLEQRLGDKLTLSMDGGTSSAQPTSTENDNGTSNASSSGSANGPNLIPYSDNPALLSQDIYENISRVIHYESNNRCSIRLSKIGIEKGSLQHEQLKPVFHFEKTGFYLERERGDIIIYSKKLQFYNVTKISEFYNGPVGWGYVFYNQNR